MMDLSRGKSGRVVWKYRGPASMDLTSFMTETEKVVSPFKMADSIGEAPR